MRFDHGSTRSKWIFTPWSYSEKHWIFSLGVLMDLVIGKVAFTKNGDLHENLKRSCMEGRNGTNSSCLNDKKEQFRIATEAIGDINAP